MLFPCHLPKRSIRHGKMLIKNVYKQMLTGKVAKFCCDFKKLEKVAEK